MNVTNTGTVYLIVNMINNHKYVGITTLPLNRRWAVHISDSRKKSYPLYRAMRKYGLKNFQICSLETVSAESKKEIISLLNECEVKWVGKHRTFIGWREGGYNLTTGGGMENISSESRKKQGMTMKRRYRAEPGLLKKYGNAIRTALRNPETRKKMQLSQRERYKNPGERERTSESIISAYETTPSLREKLSRIHKRLAVTRPELGIAQSKRISGKNHPRFDWVIYDFCNPKTGEKFSGTRYDFRCKYNLSQSKVCLLVNKKRKTHRGWRLVEE